MSSLMLALAQPSISHLAKKNWRGKPYFELGPTVLTMGAWLFERGGMVGYALRDDLELLSKVMPVANANAYQYLSNELSPTLIDSLPKEKPNFINWYAKPLLYSFGLIFPCIPLPKDWTKRISPQEAESVAAEAFLKGSIAGSIYPKEFRNVWESNYAPSDPDEWQMAYQIGLVGASEQEVLVFDDEIGDLLMGIGEWAESDTKESGFSEEDLTEIWLLGSSPAINDPNSTEDTKLLSELEINEADTFQDWISIAHAAEARIFDDDLEPINISVEQVVLDDEEQWFADRELTRSSSTLEILREKYSEDDVSYWERGCTADGAMRAAEAKFKREQNFTGAKDSWLKWLVLQQTGVVSKNQMLLLAHIYAEQGDYNRATTVVGFAESLAESEERPPMSDENNQIWTRLWDEEVSKVTSKISGKYDDIIERSEDWGATFWGDVGTRMANQIDYRADNTRGGTELAPWDDIESIARGGLFLGSSLSLASPTIADQILGKDCVFQNFEYEDVTKDWRNVYWVVVQDMKGRISKLTPASSAYNYLFPEFGGPLNQTEVSKLVARQVFRGLMLPLIDKEVSLSLIENWIQEPAGLADWRGLYVSQSYTEDTDSLNTVEQVQTTASSLYKYWLETNPGL